MPSPTAAITPAGLAVPEDPWRRGRETRDLWGGNPYTLRGNDWQVFGGAFSRAAIASAIPVDAPGAYMDTRGPTGLGFGRIQTSIFATGVSKSMTVSIRRDGVQIASHIHNSAIPDTTSGSAMDTILAIPAYPYGARYEWYWQANTAGASRTQHSAFRGLYLPSDRLRLESGPDRSVVANVASFPVLSTTGFNILWTTTGPHRRGSARLVWSINATGASKNPTRLRLHRDASPWLPAAVLYDSGDLTPPDSTSGASFDTGTIAIPASRYPVKYRFTLTTNAAVTWTNSNGAVGISNNKRYFVSQGHITVRPAR